MREVGTVPYQQPPSPPPIQVSDDYIEIEPVVLYVIMGGIGAALLCIIFAACLCYLMQKMEEEVGGGDEDKEVQMRQWKANVGGRAGNPQQLPNIQRSRHANVTDDHVDFDADVSGSQ